MSKYLCKPTISSEFLQHLGYAWGQNQDFCLLTFNRRL